MTNFGPGSMRIDLTPDRQHIKVQLAMDDLSDSQIYTFSLADYLQFVLAVQKAGKAVAEMVEPHR